jgi:hypothetical protein
VVQHFKITKMKIEDWELEIAFHFPHDRFLLGHEYINADKDFKYNTIRVYLLIATITIDYKINQ